MSARHAIVYNFLWKKSTDVVISYIDLHYKPSLPRLIALLHTNKDTYTPVEVLYVMCLIPPPL